MAKVQKTFHYINGKPVSKKQFADFLSLEKALSTFNAFMKNDCVTSKTSSYAFNK